MHPFNRTVGHSGLLLYIVSAFRFGDTIPKPEDAAAVPNFVECFFMMDLG